MALLVLATGSFKIGAAGGLEGGPEAAYSGVEPLGLIGLVDREGQLDPAANRQVDGDNVVAGAGQGQGPVAGGRVTPGDQVRPGL